VTAGMNLPAMSGTSGTECTERSDSN